jgi:hypothetical protein
VTDWRQVKFDLWCSLGMARSRVMNLRFHAPGEWDLQVAETTVARLEAQLRDHQAQRP